MISRQLVSYFLSPLNFVKISDAFIPTM